MSQALYLRKKYYLHKINTQSPCPNRARQNKSKPQHKLTLQRGIKPTKHDAGNRSVELHSRPDHATGGIKKTMLIIASPNDTKLTPEDID